MKDILSRLSILLVEDHQRLAQAVIEYLEQLGAIADYAANVPQARERVKKQKYDVILLDVMLPGEDGFQFCRVLREEYQLDTPVIFLTARDQLDDKLEGFSHGGDDYLVKPFDLPELVARILAQTRRHRGEVARHFLRIADLEVNIPRQEVRRGGYPIKLSPTGFRILLILLRKSPDVVSREQLERELWGDLVPDSDSLRSHLYNLRCAIDKPFDKELLHTHQRVGFSIQA